MRIIDVLEAFILLDSAGIGEMDGIASSISASTSQH